MSQTVRVSDVFPRHRKLRSAVWNHFTKGIKEDGSDLASCNYCKKHLSGASRCGTTHLRNHLKYCLSYQQATRKRSNSLQVIPQQLDVKEDIGAIVAYGEDSNAPVLHPSLFPRQGKLRSLVWNDFTKEKREDGSILAICNHCKKQMAGGSRCGTTHLRKHLVACLLYRKTKRRKIDVRSLLSKSSAQRNDETANVVLHEAPALGLPSLHNGSGEGFQFDQELSEQDLARMVILHEYPFSIVNHVGFRTFVMNLQPQFRLMSHTSLKDDCMKIYEEKRLKLSDVLRKFSSQVCLTAEMWNSSGNMEYLCLGCHFISDDWRLEKKVINFLPTESHPGCEGIVKVILEKLYEWEIDGKLFCVVLENSGGNDNIIQGLVHNLHLKGSLPSNGDLFHVRCYSYVLNLIVQNGLEQISESVNKIRESVNFVKSSQKKLEIFLAIAKQVGAPEKSLILDLPSRWRSTYLMIEMACEFQDAFSGMEEVDCEFIHAPSPLDWDNVRSVNECLRVFYDMSEKYSRSKFPTANHCFNDVCGILMSLKTWSTSPHPAVASVATKMLEQFEKYWDVTSTIMAASAILDPRYRMKSVEYFFKLIYTDAHQAGMKIGCVLRDFTNMYHEYVVQSGDTLGSEGFLCITDSSISDANADIGANGVLGTTTHKLTDVHFGLDEYLQENSSNKSIKSDLDLYLEEAVLPPTKEHTKFDILAWWKGNATKYPILSLMARDILGIPLTIATSETGFRGEKKELNHYYSSMNPTILQGLVCAQDWLRGEIEELSPTGILDGLSTSTIVGFCDDIEPCV
uniref:Putative AC transposase n=1 Tax=Anthurium amnicola TaxID=1678845 RepID=A0A1D1Y468_9ARAE